MDVQTAEGVTINQFAYNSQETLPSRYMKHQEVYLYPTQQNAIVSTSSNRVIRFLVGPNGFLDSKSSVFALNAQITGLMDTDKAWFTDDTDTWVSRCTILTNQGVTVDETRSANVLAGMIRREVEPSYEQSVGRASLNMLQSAGTNAYTSPTIPVGMNAADRTARGVANLRYIIELKQCGFLADALNFWPLKSMASQNSNSLQIELEFAPVSQMVVSNNGLSGEDFGPAVGNIQYNLSNIVYIQNLIFDDLKEVQLSEVVHTTPIVLAYKTHRNYDSIIPAGTASTIQIAEFQENMIQLDNCIILSDNISNPTTDMTYYSNPPLTQYQLQVGTTYFPAQPVLLNTSTGAVSNAEQYYNYAITQQKQKKTFMGFYPISFTAGSPTTTESNQNQDFILSIDLRVAPDDSVGDPMYNQFFAGINCKNNPQPLQLKTNYSSVSENQYTMYSFTTYVANLIIQANETYVIS